ncbi:MAG: M24 family metallopeptidase [Phycisphaerales bacterium]
MTDPPATTLKSPNEIDAIARAAHLNQQILETIAHHATAGTTTHHLDARARQLITQAGATPAFPGQRDLADAPPFSAALVACINDEVVHAPPSDRPLQSGDLLTLDLGIVLDAWHADAALSLVVPHADPSQPPAAEPHRIAAGAHAVLEAALARIAPGVHWSEVAQAMQAAAESLSLGIVTDFTGHGIGRHLHELPKAPHWWDPAEFEDFELVPGLVLAIEPIVTATPGRTPTRLDPDRWTVRTANGALAAHAEAMVAIDPRNARPRILAHPRVGPRAPA